MNELGFGGFGVILMALVALAALILAILAICAPYFLYTCARDLKIMREIMEKG